MVFDLLDHVRVNFRRFTGNTKGAIVHMAARPAGNLRQLFGSQVPPEGAIKFVKGGKGNMIDIHIEAHADSIGRH